MTTDLKRQFVLRTLDGVNVKRGRMGYQSGAGMQLFGLERLQGSFGYSRNSGSNRMTTQSVNLQLRYIF